MAQKKDKENSEYPRLRQDLRRGTPGRAYFFYGEERYLLEDAVKRLRALVPAGTEEFNHHRLDGKSMTMEDLAEAVDALPVFAERTVTEVWDLNLTQLGEEDRSRLVGIMSDVPDYATVVFIFDTVEFKLDGRVKANQELKKRVTAVEFQPLEQGELIRWTAKRLAADGKRITNNAAAELINFTGASMTRMAAECGKLAAFVKGDSVDVADVRAVVTPVLEAAAYELTDALLAGRSDTAIGKLSDLIRMDQEPRKIIFSVSMKLRQLLTAKLCQDNGLSMREFMKLAGINYDFQARSLWDLARRQTVDRCAELVKLCAGTAYKLNSSVQDEEELMTELAVRILTVTGARA